jgi:predicted nuclease of restriction endonuclease-like (RecB) superfamily
MVDSPAHPSGQLPADYPEFLAEVKARIASARTRAVLAVNSELIQLYWEIGRDVIAREEREGWGSKVIDRLASDLRREFPNMTGLSRSNLHYMRAFAKAWPAEEASSGIVQQVVGRLPWGHNIALITKLEELLNDIQSFLMEMGREFALVGRQFPLEVIDEETGRRSAWCSVPAAARP